MFFTKLSADITHVPFVVQTSMYFFHIFDWKLFISFYFLEQHCTAYTHEWNVKWEVRKGRKRRRKIKIRTWVMRRTLMCLQKHMWRPNNTEKMSNLYFTQGTCVAFVVFYIFIILFLLLLLLLWGEAFKTSISHASRMHAI